MTAIINRKKIRRSRSDIIFDAVVYLIMLLFLVICLYPLYFILIASVSDPALVSTGKVLLIPKGVSLDAYARIAREAKIWIGYRNTVVYTVLGTAINIFCTITGGYALSRSDLRGKKHILMILAFTMFFNGGMIPTYMVVKGLNMINTVWAMVIPSAVSVWNLMITRSFFESTIPGELLDAAMIDGCGNLRFFARIVVPISPAIIAVMVLFYAITHWNSYFSALIYLESERLYPLQIILRNILIANQPQPGMMEDVRDLIERQKLADLLKYGVIVVASLPMMVIYPFIQKYFVTGVMVGSIKG